MKYLNCVLHSELNGGGKELKGQDMNTVMCNIEFIADVAPKPPFSTLRRRKS